MIYTITYLGLFLGASYEIFLNKKKKLASLFFIFLLFIIAIFRINTGTDFQAYLNLWNNVNIFDPSKTHLYSYVEIGFRFIISFLRLFTQSDFLFFSFLAAVPLYFYNKAINNLNLPPTTALIFYFTFFYFAYLLNAIGQAFTISLALYSLKFIIEKKLKQVLTICIIATLIHTSGLSIIFIYILMNIKLRPVISFFSSLILGLIFLKFHIINNLFDVVFSSKFDVYYSYFTAASSIFQIATKLLIFSLFFAFSLKIKDTLFSNLFRAYSFGIFLFLSLLEQNALGTRLFMIFKPLEIIMILIIFEHCKNAFSRFILFLVFLMPYTYQFIVNINSPNFYFQFRF